MSNTMASLEPESDPMGVFSEYEPQTEDPGPYLWMFTLFVCLAAYFVLLPLLLLLRYLCCRGDDAEQSNLSGKKRKKEGFHAIEGCIDDDNRFHGDNVPTGRWSPLESLNSGVGQLWETFHDEIFSESREGVEIMSWEKPEPSPSYCALLLASLLEQQPARQSYWQRQRQQLKKRNLRALIREESRLGHRPPETASNPLLFSSSSQEQSSLFPRDCRVIIRLSCSYAIPELGEGLLNIVTLGIIGRTMHTSDLVAYLAVTRFLGWTMGKCVSNGVLRGLQLELQNCTSPIEVGQYTQGALIILLLIQSIFWAIWTSSMGYLLNWIQMDDETIILANNYTYIALLLAVLKAFADCVHFLLVRSKHEFYSQAITLLEQASILLIAGIWTTFDDSDLITFGFVQLELGVTFLIWNIGVSLYTGWLECYQPGLLRRCARTDIKIMNRLLKQAFPLMIGNLFLGSIWEILMLLAAFLGPAEFVVWCIFGAIWDAATGWLDGMGFAASLRCESLLALGKPAEAYRSAVISIFMIFIPLTMTISSLLFLRDLLPTWITNDSTLHELLRTLLAFLEIGVATTVVGHFNWELLRCQSRNYAAAFTSWLSQWFVVIPLATTLSVHLLVDLQGQTVAYILGQVLSGGVQFYLFSTFRWNDTLNEVATNTSSTVANSLHSNKGIHTAKQAASSTFIGAEERLKIQSRKERSIEIEPRIFQPFDQSQVRTSRDQKSTSSSSDSSELDEIASNASSSLFGDSTLSTGVSSYQSISTASRSATASIAASEISTPEFHRVFAMQPGTNQAADKRKLPPSQRHPPPMSPLIEESSASSTTTSVHSDSKASTAVSSYNLARSEASPSDESLVGYRRTSGLGALSRKELVQRQQDLHKMLIALKATLRYNLGRSKLRILEELQWVFEEYPDIVEVEHLEPILGLMRVDEECRREFWSSIRVYLPVPLQRMGVDLLIQNDYLGPHHIKARMDKFVLESRAESNNLHQEEDSYVDDDRVHSACEMQHFGIPSCFVIRK